MSFQLHMHLKLKYLTFRYIINIFWCKKGNWIRKYSNEVNEFTLWKCLNAHNSGFIEPIEMNWVSLESTISDLFSDTATITIGEADPEVYAFTLWKCLNEFTLWKCLNAYNSDPLNLLKWNRHSAPWLYAFL